MSVVLQMVASFWVHTCGLRVVTIFWWLGGIRSVGSADMSFLVRFLDNPGPVKVMLRPELYSTDPSACRYSGCLQRHRSCRGIVAGVRRHGIGLA